MLDRLREHLAETDLIPIGQPVVVGYSGGADSTCLLHALHHLKYDVIAAHLEHGQRLEGGKEAALAQAFCDEFGVPFVGGKADVPRMSRDLRIGIEEAGRKARYAFFAQVVGRTEAAVVATAHTRSDHVETVILNLVRGAGLGGAAGIPTERDGIVRPLLPFSRSETRAYCEEHGLWFHDDPTNEDLQYARPRIRRSVMPVLREIQPAAEEAIARFADLAGEEDRFLNGMAAAALEQSEVPLNGSLKFLTEDIEVSFHRPVLNHLPVVLFRRSVRLAVEALGATLDRHQTEIIVQGVRAGVDGSVTAEGGGVVVEWTDARIDVRVLAPQTPYRHPLTLPGETSSEEFGWQFVAFPDANDSTAVVRAELSTKLSYRGVRGDLYFRTAQPGDQMQPLGFSGRRKLSDLLAEGGLTVAARRRLPIICDLVGPIWAPGVCLDARVVPDHSEERVIRIQFGHSNRQNRHNDQ